MRRDWAFLMLSQVCLILVLGVIPPLAVSQGAAPARKDEGKASGSEPNKGPTELRLNVQPQEVIMDNGILQVTLSVPGGFVTAIRYNGVDDILDKSNDIDERGYWDANWMIPGTKTQTSKLTATKFEVVKQDKEQIELSFLSLWSSDHSDIPLNVDKRFVMLPGLSGFYSYGIYERVAGMPDVDIDETRIVFKLNKNKFRYMAVSDEIQRMMPLLADRESGKPLAYPEAVLLTKATDPAMTGEVDDKYQYSCDNKDNKVHGWVSLAPPVGFWTISGSNEFRTGGPTKQDLTTHVGPNVLNMFVSLHYAGKVSGLSFRKGEPWKKVFGPVLVYLNSKMLDGNPVTLWNDSKAQMMKETESWPYNFPLSKDYLRAPERGQVSGQLLVCDRLGNKDCTPADKAHVGLATPGPAGSWQVESKGYQFWTQTDEKGNFVIKGVRPGKYNLNGWAPGSVGDFLHDPVIDVAPGSEIKLGPLRFNPPRSGPTLWEIGIPDRTAAEFFIPDADPGLVNRLFLKQDKFRQYGLWDRYAELYPKDLEFTIGTSDYRKDWFFAHVNRKKGNNAYAPTTWQILFDLKEVVPTQTYVLRVAVAAATEANLQIHVNNPKAKRPVFIAPLKERDNAIARHGIHGIYSLQSVNISGSALVNGKNTIFLTQVKSIGPFQGIMYDYIRLEAPPPAGTKQS